MGRGSSSCGTDTSKRRRRETRAVCGTIRRAGTNDRIDVHGASRATGSSRLVPMGAARGDPGRSPILVPVSAIVIAPTIVVASTIVIARWSATLVVPRITIPAMVVAHDASRPFPVPFVVLTVDVVGRDPVRTFVRRTSPVAVQPPVVTVLRVPIAFDPDVVRAWRAGHAVGAGRRRCADAYTDGDLSGCRGCRPTDQEAQQRHSCQNHSHARARLQPERHSELNSGGTVCRSTPRASRCARVGSHRQASARSETDLLR